MKHEEDGRLMAYVDGELLAEDAHAVENHLGRCADCALATSRLRNEKERVRRALSDVDVDAGAAYRRVGDRLRQSRAGAVGNPSRDADPVRSRGSAIPARARPGAARGVASWLRRTRALQAALFVLFMAGGAAAVMPGSPLRRWLVGSADEAVAPASAPARLQAPEAAAQAAEPVSLSAAPSGGRLRVALELPAGTELRIVLAEGERATVSANPDTRFTSAEGVLEAVVSGGSVRVEFPRGAADASLEVNGELYVRAQGGDVRFTAPAADSSDAEVSFRIRER
jgi:hypothetical protein